MNLHPFATELEHEGQAALKRAGQLLVMASSLREMPATNAPTAQMRKLLGDLGFAVVHRDALRCAAACMDTVDEHPEGWTGAEAFDKALKAVHEALAWAGGGS